MAITLTTHFRFLELPRELRDLCYEFYFGEEDGYIYVYEIGRLRTLRGQHIDLSLTLVCRQMHAETEGLAFALNKITFNAFTARSVNEWIYHFGSTIEKLWREKLKIMKELRPFFTSAMAQKAVKKYPQHRIFIQSFLSGRTDPEWDFETIGPSPSIMRDCIQYILGLLITHPDLPQPVYRSMWKVVASFHEPWIITNEKDIRSFYQSWKDTPTQCPRINRNEPDDERGKYILSAACVCIRFMRTLPPGSLLQLRHITLQQDFVSVGFPECHARGLISFCQTNPNLRIEHRIDLWTCVLLSADVPMNPEGYRNSKYLHAHAVSKALRSWLLEASALPSLGMPENRFRLVLNGNLMPEKSTQILQIVQRDAEWQVAWWKSSPRLGYFEKRAHCAYICERFPEIIESIVRGNGSIRCNFDTREVGSEQKIPRDPVTWSATRWEKEWPTQSPATFETDLPLLPWSSLRSQWSLSPYMSTPPLVFSLQRDSSSCEVSGVWRLWREWQRFIFH